MGSYVSCTAVENFIESGKEGDGGDGGGQNVADRLSQKHAEHRVRQQVRQDEDERDQQDDLAQAGQQLTLACPSAIKLCWQAIWKPMAKMPAM